MVYSSDYKIDSKLLGGRSNPKHYLGSKRNKDDESENHNNVTAVIGAVSSIPTQVNKQIIPDTKTQSNHKIKLPSREVKEHKEYKENNDKPKKELSTKEKIKKDTNTQPIIEQKEESQSEEESSEDNVEIPPAKAKISHSKKKHEFS